MEVVGKFMCPATWSSRAYESPFSKSQMNLPACLNVGHSPTILRPAAGKVNHQNVVARSKKKASTHLKLNAVLMDPTSTDVQKSRTSLLEFGKLSEELMNPIITTHAQRMKAESPEDSERLRRVMIPLHKLRQGGFVENHSFMYRQVFVIRSYEAGADKTISIDKIFSLFQVSLSTKLFVGFSFEFANRNL